MKAEQEGLFAESAKSGAPLAERMRPQSLEEIEGQEEVIGSQSPFGQIIKSSNVAIPSVILFGPPGVGKTTIARVIAKSCNYAYTELSGVLDGVKELREAVVSARSRLHKEGKRTLAVVDEIHRFNKAQQDAFLPHVESGLLTVIGMTTENVSFRLRNALLSRMKVLELKPLSKSTLRSLLERALSDMERGLGKLDLKINSEALDFLSTYVGGDVRSALNNLEWAATYVHSLGRKQITLQDVEECLGKQVPPFDHDADYHYDTISAFIKSMRGSDPDAALYYMITALEGGEDPLFITRRMIIFASEDVSCDPRALPLAIAADKAVERVGLPEGRIPMAHIATYLACAPKSNASYKALREMEKVVRQNPGLPIPRRLRNAPTELMRELGNSVGYHYPHDFPDAFVPERYLPEELGNLEVYNPSDRGIDQQIKNRLEYLRQKISTPPKKK